jgi:tetratricopeptide (TPR) repeat protein
LKVISRTSTQKYQSSPDNLREIAQQLGVTNILEGSVQRAADQVRITVQLINAATDAHLWAETYDRKLTDIFGVESDVAQRIAISLEARLTGREKQQLVDLPTKNPQAYDAYLRAISLITHQSIEDVRQARESLQQAVELDPAYAQAWAQLAIAESEIYAQSEHTQPQFERARLAAETAIRLQPELGDAHGALGLFYYMCLQDLDRALQELEEARKRSPNDANILFYIGLVKRRQGKLDESIEFQRKASVVDPRNPDVWVNLGTTYRGKRDFASAREMFERAHAISPDELDIIGHQAETYVAEGNLDAAENLLRGRKFGALDAAFNQYLTCLIYRRQFEQAIKAISENLAGRKGLPSSFYASQKEWVGELMSLNGDPEKGRPVVEQARRDLIALRDQGDTSSRITQGLIFANATLGDRNEMERETATLRQKTQHDLWQGPASEEVIAGAYAILGDADTAIPIIAHLLSVPYRNALTPAQLRLDPILDKIRNDARFQKLTNPKP